MASNSSLNLVSLDFDTLKDSFKTYLQSQTEFKDYNFESSNMNVLMSLLAYNTYLNSFYLNMATAESFLDTALLRDSVVSHAKLLNYVPSSYKSPKAVVDFSFEAADAIKSIKIPKGTPFSGTNANGAFTYVTDVDHVVASGNTTFTKSIDLYEGSYINETFIVDHNIENQRFVLSNPNIDTDSLAVTVYENNGANVYEYKRAENLYGLSSNSNIFFLQAYQDKYEIVFGDGIFGHVPINNSTVLGVYRITKGTDGGAVSEFNCDRDIGAYNSTFGQTAITINVVGSAGANVESVESIRFRAPRYFQTQNRAITKNDYKTLIIDNFNEIKAVSVYGGEENTDLSSINYGKIYISTLTYGGAFLSEDRKQDVYTYIKDKMTIGLTPELIDPEILYVYFDIKMTYDPTVTTQTPADIISSVYAEMAKFNNTYLKNFDTIFRYSRFTEALLTFDPSIISNQITIYAKKIVSTPLLKDQSINFSIGNEIVPGTIESSVFLKNDGLLYSFVDFNPLNNTLSPSITGDNPITNSTNILYLKLSDPAKQQYVPYGTIDYKSGTISIKNITVVDFLTSTGIEFIMSTVYDDTVAKNNNVIEIDLNGTNITVVTP